MSGIRVIRTCEVCGQQFEARSAVRNVCSPKCYQRKRYQERKKGKAVKGIAKEEAALLSAAPSQRQFPRQGASIERMQELSQKPYLSMAETAELLDCSRQTVYNLAAAGTLEVVQLAKRLTLVSQESIKKMIEAHTGHYKARAKPSDLSLESLYSLREITAMYDVTASAVHEAAKRKKILKVSSGGKVYFDRKGIDSYFSERKNGDTDTLWYSVAEACKKFGCTPSSINTYCLRNKIPHRKEKGRVFYHASSLDKAKGIDCRDTYYTGAEAANKYGYDRQTLYRIIHKNNIPYKMIGRRLYVEKIPLDAFMSDVGKM